MAEIVEHRLAKSIDQLNILVEFGIFSEKEAKDIVSKREKFEYSIRKRAKCKLDFLKYIRFEIGVIEALDKYRKSVMDDYHKRKKMMRPMDQDKESPEAIQNEIMLLQAKKLSDVTRAMASNISYLFRKLAYKFRFDTNIWRAYIDFAMSRGWNSRVSALYWRLLRNSPNDVKIWIDAANHEVYVNKAYDAARTLYLRGLRHHRQSTELWFDYFRMELRYMDLIAKRANLIFKTNTKESQESKEVDGDVAMWDEDPTKPGEESEDMDVAEDEESHDSRLNCDASDEVNETQIKINKSVQLSEDDPIIHGRLPQIVYDQARANLKKNFELFVTKIMIAMLKIDRSSSGLAKLKIYIEADLTKLVESEDERVSRDFVELCNKLDHLENHLLKLTADTIEPGSTGADDKTQTKSHLTQLYECYESQGVEAARSLYAQLSRRIDCQTLSLYVGMIQVEQWCLAKDTKNHEQIRRIRAIYEDALCKFGDKNAKLWYEYLKFEHRNARSLEDFDRINGIYQRSQQNLTARLADKVVEKYTLIKDNSCLDDHSDYSDLD